MGDTKGLRSSRAKSLLQTQEIREDFPEAGAGPKG